MSVGARLEEQMDAFQASICTRHIKRIDSFLLLAACRSIPKLSISPVHVSACCERASTIIRASSEGGEEEKVGGAEPFAHGMQARNEAKFNVLQALVHSHVVSAFIVLQTAERAQATGAPDEQQLGVDQGKGGEEGG